MVLKKLFKQILAPLCIILSFLSIAKSMAQGNNTISWTTSVSKVSQKEVIIAFTANIQEPWRMYAASMTQGGPLPTTFSFEKSSDFQRIGDIEEVLEPQNKLDPTFLIPVLWFERKAIFTQRIQLQTNKTTVIATVEFMLCNDHTCLLPQQQKFEIPVSLSDKSS